MKKLDEFQFGKVDALSQFHIVRRLAPVVGELLAVVSNSGVLKSGKKLESAGMDDIDFDAIAKDIGPVFSALAKLPDEDVNYCLFGLLRGVTRKQLGGGFAPVMAPNSKDLVMFDDIKGDMALMLMLAAKSFAANLGGFINALPSGLKEGALNSTVSG